MPPVATGRRLPGWRRSAGKRPERHGGTAPKTSCPSLQFDLVARQRRRVLIAFDANVATNQMVDSGRAVLACAS